MDQTCKPSDLFVKLSSRVAAALAAHLDGNGACSNQADGKAALFAAWESLPEAVRQELLPALARIQDVSCRQARRYVLEHARASRRDACPSVDRLLDAVSTPDLAVRLYLDDPSALERAHFEYVTALFEQVTTYQGQYIADVIPSYDRRARMLKTLHSLGGSEPQRPWDVLDLVSDECFVMALHRGAHVTTARHFDAARQLEPNLGQAEIDLALLFRFDSSLLIVKAKTRLERVAIREAFAQIFVGDPRYFAAPSHHSPRYRLSIDPALVAPTARPSLVKTSARPRLSVLSRDVLRA